jgi:hypothetical protein
MSDQDPRRNRPIEVKWVGEETGYHPLGRISIDGEHWANVEWSYKRTPGASKMPRAPASSTPLTFAARRRAGKPRWSSPWR